jgi:pimeloyl-ACP methyl ester carboxylesterase
MAREDVEFGVGKERCAAWLYRPADQPGPLPAVILGTGFSCVRDQGLDKFAERFAAAGYLALAFDYRHFGDSDGRPRQLALASRQRDDYRGALAFVRSLPDVDPDRIALWGYSFGGGHVQHLATTEPGIAAAICVAPVVNLLRSLHLIGGVPLLGRMLAAGGRDVSRAVRGADPYLIPAVGPPGSGAVLSSPDSERGLAAMTPAGSTWRNAVCARAAWAPPYLLERRVRRIGCPVLYCITEEDDVNPPALGRRAAASAPDGELRLYPGGHYELGNEAVYAPMVADQIEFLASRLPRARPAP